MPKHQEQTKHRLLTDDEWVRTFEAAVNDMKLELGQRMLNCDDDKVYELRAMSRVLLELVSAVRRQVYQDV